MRTPAAAWKAFCSSTQGLRPGLLSSVRGADWLVGSVGPWYHCARMEAKQKSWAMLSVGLAFLPLVIGVILIEANASLIGGALFNPVSIAAYTWLAITIANYKRSRTKAAAWLFALFPIAFGFPFLFVLFWLWGESGVK
jgi:hypothetical protein